MSRSTRFNTKLVMSENQRFIDLMENAINSLPQDLHAVARIAEDPDLEESEREQICGALIHVLSGCNALPGARGLLRHIGDVVILRLVLFKLVENNPEAMSQHQSEYPELFESLSDDVALIKQNLGPAMSLFEQAIANFSKLHFKGHNAARCARESEETMWLYDAVLAAMVDKFDFDEDEVGREVKKVEATIRPIRERLSR